MTINQSKLLPTYLTVVLLGFGSFGLMQLFAMESYADYATASASASVTVAVACTMGHSENPTHTATVPAGTYQSEIGITTFNVICNDASGYSIYAVGYSNSEYGNNFLLHEDRTLVALLILPMTLSLALPLLAIPPTGP